MKSFKNTEEEEFPKIEKASEFFKDETLTGFVLRLDNGLNWHWLSEKQVSKLGAAVRDSFVKPKRKKLKIIYQ